MSSRSPRKEMYTVYVLYSHKDNKLYVGHTTDIENRVAMHNNGEVQSTKGRRPLELAHQEYFHTEAEAVQREQFLKSLWGAREKGRIFKKFTER